MSRTGVAVVAELYAGLDRSDLSAVRGHIAIDCVLDQPGYLPWSGRYYGPDGFLAFFRTLSDYLDTQGHTETIFDGGDVVVRVGRTEGTVRANGTPFRCREVHLLTVRDSLIIGFRAHLEVPVMQAALTALPRLPTPRPTR
jgi:hypothetical protein